MLFRLGELYEGTGDYAKARENFANVVKLDPKFVEGLLALGRVEIRQGEYQDSLKPLNEALTLAIDLGNQEVRGNVLQAIGIAYKRLNKPDEALRNFEESLAIKTDDRRQARDGLEPRRDRTGQGQPRRIT